MASDLWIKFTMFVLATFTIIAAIQVYGYDIVAQIPQIQQYVKIIYGVAAVIAIYVLFVVFRR